MKTLAILFTLFYFLNALAVAPYGFKGQNQTQTLYSNVLQFPNNQVTNLGGINALVEVGNKNILSNPGFEAPLSSSLPPSWVSSIFSSALSTPIDGKSSIGFFPSAQTFTFTQNSNLYATQFADGVQGLASIMVKSDVALKVCPIQASVTSTTNCVDVVPNSKWGLYKVPFILGATNNGISIASSGAVTGNIFLDDAFVGAVDLQSSVDASKVAGESYFPGTSTCNWVRVATAAMGPFNTVAACPGPTIAYSSLGSWQTTDSDLPRQTINNLPAGTYKAKFNFASNDSASVSTGFTITDGTTTCEPSQGNGGSVTNFGQVECVFTYNSSGNRTFELYAGQTAAGTISVFNGVTAPRFGTRFILEYFGNSSVYSSTNADTDWDSCGHTAASFTGLGTVTAINTQCKRQGSDLLMKGSFTVGTVTAVEARLSLPVWNGSQLVSAGSSIIPSLQLSGDMIYSSSSTVTFRHGTLIEPSVSYMTFAYQGSTNAAFQKILGTVMSANNQSFSFSSRIPIEGWQGSNVIIGEFNGLQNCTSTIACTDTFSATISSAGVVSNENVDFISGNCSKGGTGITNCTINAGIFSVVPNLVSTIDDGSGTCRESRSIGTNTNTFFRVDTLSSAGAAADCQFRVVIQKQGADYVGKTAFAVASDQNLRTPGVTKGVVYSAFIGSTGSIVSEIGDFISGSCTVASTNVFTCNFTAGIFASDPFCQLTVMGASGAARNGYIVTNPTTSSITYLTYNTSGATPTALNAFLTCHGVSL
jgi:hypothetical protein